MNAQLAPPRTSDELRSVNTITDVDQAEISDNDADSNISPSSTQIPQHLVEQHMSRVRMVQHITRPLEHADIFSRKSSKFWYRTIILFIFGIIPLVFEIIFTISVLSRIWLADQWLEVTPYNSSALFNSDSSPLIVFTPDVSLSRSILLLNNQKFDFGSNTLQTINSNNPVYPKLDLYLLFDITSGYTSSLVMSRRSSFTNASDSSKECTVFDSAFQIADDPINNFGKYGDDDPTGTVSLLNQGDLPVRIEQEASFYSSLAVLLSIGLLIKWIISLFCVWVISWDVLFFFGPWWEILVRHSIALAMFMYLSAGLSLIPISSIISSCVDFSSPLYPDQMIHFQVYIWIALLAALCIHILGFIPKYIRYFFSHDPMNQRPSFCEGSFLSRISILVCLFCVIADLSTLLYAAASGVRAAIFAILHPALLILCVILHNALKLNRRDSRIDLRFPPPACIADRSRNRRKLALSVEQELIKSLTASSHYDLKFISFIHQDIEKHAAESSEMKGNNNNIINSDDTQSSPPPTNINSTVLSFQNFISEEKKNALSTTHTSNFQVIRFESLNESLLRPMTSKDVELLRQLDQPLPIPPSLSPFDKLCIRIKKLSICSRWRTLNDKENHADSNKQNIVTDSAITGIGELNIQNSYNNSNQSKGVDVKQFSEIHKIITKYDNIDSESHINTKVAMPDHSDIASDENLCQVCFDSPCNIILHPCHHSGLCSQCAAAVVSTALRHHVQVTSAGSSTQATLQGFNKLDDRAIVKCPICRESVRAILKVKRTQSLSMPQLRNLLVSLQQFAAAEEISNIEDENTSIISEAVIALQVPKRLVELPNGENNNANRTEEGTHHAVRSYSPSRGGALPRNQPNSQNEHNYRFSTNGSREITCQNKISNNEPEVLGRSLNSSLNFEDARKGMHSNNVLIHNLPPRGYVDDNSPVASPFVGGASPTVWKSSILFPSMIGGSSAVATNQTYFPAHSEAVAQHDSNIASSQFNLQTKNLHHEVSLQEQTQNQWIDERVVSDSKVFDARSRVTTLLPRIEPDERLLMDEKKEDTNLMGQEYSLHGFNTYEKEHLKDCPSSAIHNLNEMDKLNSFNQLDMNFHTVDSLPGAMDSFTSRPVSLPHDDNFSSSSFSTLHDSSSSSSKSDRDFSERHHFDHH